VVTAIAEGDERDEIAHELRDAELGRDVDGGAALGRRADPRKRQKVTQRRLRRHDARERLELGGDDVHLLALAREIEERPGVGLRRRLAVSHEPILAIASSTMRRWSSSRSDLRTRFAAIA